YASPSCDSSGNGEGTSWIGVLTPTPDGNGDFIFSDSALTDYAAPGSFITATATDQTIGETSEFSACKQASVPAGSTFTVTTNADSGAGSLREAINAANSVPGTDTIAFALPGPSLQITLASALPAITQDLILD